MNIEKSHISKALIGLTVLGGALCLAGGIGLIDYFCHNFQFPNNLMNPAIQTICTDLLIAGGVTCLSGGLAIFIFHKAFPLEPRAQR